MPKNITEHKLRLGSILVGHELTETQKRLFNEDHTDFSFHFYLRQTGATTGALSHTLTEAYWHADTQYLVLTSNGDLAAAAFNRAIQMMGRLCLERPERVYKDSSSTKTVSIHYGSTGSSVRFASKDANLAGKHYHGVVLDLNYQELTLDLVDKASNLVMSGMGSLRILATHEEDMTEVDVLPPTPSKLDAVLDQIAA
ncbi:MAG: hypothetical protein JSS66_07440 [Armatimonadetes bacterium]|nr:hypothetical protein [Armatimonadota bacterium]